MSATTEPVKLSESAYNYFIDEAPFHALLQHKTDAGELSAVIAKSMDKQALSLADTAVLLAADDEESCHRFSRPPGS